MGFRTSMTGQSPLVPKPSTVLVIEDPSHPLRKGGVKPFSPHSTNLDRQSPDKTEEKVPSKRGRIRLREEGLFLWETKNSTIIEKGLGHMGGGRKQRIQSLSPYLAICR